MKNKIKKPLKIKPVQAIRLLDIQADGEHVHIFKNNGNILVGFDKKFDTLYDEIYDADSIEIGGDACMAMKHGIVIFPKGAEFQSDLIFVAHNEKKMKLFLKRNDI